MLFRSRDAKHHVPSSLPVTITANASNNSVEKTSNPTTPGLPADVSDEVREDVDSFTRQMNSVRLRNGRIFVVGGHDPQARERIESLVRYHSQIRILINIIDTLQEFNFVWRHVDSEIIDLLISQAAYAPALESLVKEARSIGLFEDNNPNQNIKDVLRNATNAENTCRVLNRLSGTGLFSIEHSSRMLRNRRNLQRLISYSHLVREEDLSGFILVSSSSLFDAAFEHNQALFDSRLNARIRVAHNVGMAGALISFTRANAGHAFVDSGVNVVSEIAKYAIPAPPPLKPG